MTNRPRERVLKNHPGNVSEYIYLPQCPFTLPLLTKRSISGGKKWARLQMGNHQTPQHPPQMKIWWLVSRVGMKRFHMKRPCSFLPGIHHPRKKSSTLKGIKFTKKKTVYLLYNIKTRFKQSQCRSKNTNKCTKAKRWIWWTDTIHLRFSEQNLSKSAAKKKALCQFCLCNSIGSHVSRDQLLHYVCIAWKRGIFDDILG